MLLAVYFVTGIMALFSAFISYCVMTVFVIGLCFGNTVRGFVC